MKKEPLFKVERERETGLVILHLTCSVFRQHCDISNFLHSSWFSFHLHCPVIDQKHGLKSPWSGQSCLSSRRLPHPCVLVNERLVLLSSERASCYQKTRTKLFRIQPEINSEFRHTSQ